jgi:hypothetical protein
MPQFLGRRSRSAARFAGPGPAKFQGRRLRGTRIREVLGRRLSHAPGSSAGSAPDPVGTARVGARDAPCGSAVRPSVAADLIDRTAARAAAPCSGESAVAAPRRPPTSRVIASHAATARSDQRRSHHVGQPAFQHPYQMQWHMTLFIECTSTGDALDPAAAQRVVVDVPRFAMAATSTSVWPECRHRRRTCPVTHLFSHLSVRSHSRSH